MKLTSYASRMSPIDLTGDSPEPATPIQTAYPPRPLGGNPRILTWRHSDVSEAQDRYPRKKRRVEETPEIVHRARVRVGVNGIIKSIEGEPHPPQSGKQVH